MKLRLEIDERKHPGLRMELLQMGIEIDDAAALALRDAEDTADKLLLKSASGDIVAVAADLIIFAESFGHKLELHTQDEVLSSSEPLYKLAARLDDEKFLRISNSVIINCNKVQRISPTLTMKFILTMCNGQKVDVTRSYYYIFKERFGI